MRRNEVRFADITGNLRERFWLATGICPPGLLALGTLHFMTEENQFTVAITGSLKFVEQGKHAEALKPLDDAIAEAKRGQMGSWIRTLCHHAAIVSSFSDNLTSAQHYYEESLTSDPENARALYGLATVALDQGHLEIAKQYAKRCHTAIRELERATLPKANDFTGIREDAKKRRQVNHQAHRQRCRHAQDRFHMLAV
jgi:tetratricopeptide (TPR) repeat protein